MADNAYTDTDTVFFQYYATGYVPFVLMARVFVDHGFQVLLVYHPPFILRFLCSRHPILCKTILNLMSSSQTLNHQQQASRETAVLNQPQQLQPPSFFSHSLLCPHLSS